MTLKTVIVGLGRIGMGYDLALDPARHVLSHARAFSLHPRFSLQAGVDSSAVRRDTFSLHYGCPAYADLGAALAVHHPELVVIAVPTPQHCACLQQILALSRPTPQAILCEKPLAYDLHDAKKMLTLCATKGVALYVNYMRRSDAGVIEIERRLSSAEIGGPLKGVCWYSKGFQHNGSHLFNLLQYWLGPMMEFGVIDPGRPWSTEQAEAAAEAEPDVRVSFRHGEIVFLAAREEAFSHSTIELLASNGRLRYEQGGKLIEWQAACRNRLLPAYTTLAVEPEIIPNGLERYQWHVAEQLASALDDEAGNASAYAALSGQAEKAPEAGAGNRPPALCSGADALATLLSMHAILERCAAGAGRTATGKESRR
jgi:predicted dehydrogenase